MFFTFCISVVCNLTFIVTYLGSSIRFLIFWRPNQLWAFTKLPEDKSISLKEIELIVDTRGISRSIIPSFHVVIKSNQGIYFFWTRKRKWWNDVFMSTYKYFQLHVNINYMHWCSMHYAYDLWSKSFLGCIFLSAFRVRRIVNSNEITYR